jgi:alcohol dehydrogenase
MLPAMLDDLLRSVALPAAKRAAGVALRLVPIPQPTLLVGPGASVRLAQAVARCGHHKLLVVSDATLRESGLLRPLLAALDERELAYALFDGAAADAPIDSIEAGLAVYHEQGCDAVLACGGGSVIDAAKAIALAAANDKPLRQLAGYFRARHAPAPLYAVPTTAGTGSETSVAAVISDPKAQRKLLIVDTRIVPRMAALDPSLMTGLPRHITAATGMDALTHAVEACIGHWATPESDRMALAAVAMIYENLPVACAVGQDLAAREQMALAANYAGQAFTRANVGNVHAIAHQLGARYHTPHGLANAMLLPHVLRFEAAAAADKLAALALAAKLGDAAEPAGELARRFVASVDTLNRTLGIPAHLDALREADIAALAQAACDEADFNYPVPRVMTRPDCERLLRQLLPPPVAPAANPPRTRRRSTAAARETERT